MAGYSEYFNKMADKKVCIGEWKQKRDEIYAQEFSVLERARIVMYEQPKSSLQALFSKTSSTTDKALEEEMYVARTGFPMLSKNWVVTLAAFKEMMNDVKGASTAEIAAESFEARLYDVAVRAWNNADDKSEEVDNGAYIPMKQRIENMFK